MPPNPRSGLIIPRKNETIIAAVAPEVNAQRQPIQVRPGLPGDGRHVAHTLFCTEGAYQQKLGVDDNDKPAGFPKPVPDKTFRRFLFIPCTVHLWEKVVVNLRELSNALRNARLFEFL